MIFRRETSAASTRLGGAMTSCRMPSTRYRIPRVPFPGSMWMSEAPRLSPSRRIEFTSRTIGTSSAKDRSALRSTWPFASSPLTISISAAAASTSESIFASSPGTFT